MTSVVTKTGVLPRVLGRWLDLEWGASKRHSSQIGADVLDYPQYRHRRPRHPRPSSHTRRGCRTWGLSSRRTRVIAKSARASWGLSSRRKLVPPTPHLSLERRLALPSANASNATPTASIERHPHGFHQAAYRAARMRVSLGQP